MDNTPFFKKCVEIYEEEYKPSREKPRKINKEQLLSGNSFLQDSIEINSLLRELDSFIDGIQKEYLLSSSKMSEKAKDEVDSTLKLQLSVSSKKIDNLSRYAKALNQKMEATNGVSFYGIRKNLTTMGEYGESVRLQTDTVCEIRNNIVKALGLKLTEVSDKFMRLNRKRMARKREINKSSLVTNQEYNVSSTSIVEDFHPGGVSQEYKEMHQELDQQQLLQLTKENEDLTLQLKEQDLNSVTRMESSVLEISSMVNEIGMQLNLQNENIEALAGFQDDILSNVQSGNVQLKKANERSKNGGRNMSAMIMTLSIVLLVIDYIL